MGMSAEALQGQQQGDAPAPGTEGQQGQGQVAPPPEYSPFALEYLKGVPDAQRTLLEPHIKQWDANVTKKFQELHSQLEPYQALGVDHDTLQQALQLAQLMDEQPELIYKVLTEELGFGSEQGQMGQQQPQQPVGGFSPGMQQQAPLQQGQMQQSQEIPPHFEDRFSKIENVVGQLADILIQSRQQASESQEDQQYDLFLQDLQTQFGEFDEDWVTLRISQGMDGAQAVQAWQAMIQDRMNQGGAGPVGIPKTLGNGSVAPGDTLRPGKMPNKDVVALAASLIEQTNREGG